MTIKELNEKINSDEIENLRYIHHQYGEVDYIGNVVTPGTYFYNMQYVTVVEDD